MQRERNELESSFSSVAVLIIPVHEPRMDRRSSHDGCIKSFRKPHGNFDFRRFQRRSQKFPLGDKLEIPEKPGWLNLVN